MKLPCDACNGDGFVSFGDRHVENRKESCATCGGTGEIEARTGERPESSAPLAIPVGELANDRLVVGTAPARHVASELAHADITQGSLVGKLAVSYGGVVCTDPLVESVRADLLQRSRLGLIKYGTPLATAPLALRDFAQHAYEEALDLANYLKCVITELDGTRQAPPPPAQPAPNSTRTRPVAWLLEKPCGETHLTEWLPHGDCKDCTITPLYAAARATPDFASLRAEGMETAPDSTRTGVAETERPDGAIHNGREHLRRLGLYGFTANDGHLLGGCEDYIGAQQCFEVMAEALAARPEAPSDAQPAHTPVIDIQPMALSDGRKDYFVRIRCGDRECTPYVFRERYQAEYSADHFKWIFHQLSDEPGLMAYNETTHPND